MPESECKSRWKMAVWCIMLLPVLYWISAPMTLLVSEKDPDEYSHQPAFMPLPPDWWRKAYTPVLWAAEQPVIGSVIIKPFSWISGEEEVEQQLQAREYSRDPLSWGQ